MRPVMHWEFIWALDCWNWGDWHFDSNVVPRNIYEKIVELPDQLRMGQGTIYKPLPQNP